MLAHPTRSARLEKQLEDEMNPDKANGSRKPTKAIKAKANAHDDEHAPSLKAPNALLALKKRVEREIANKIISSEQDASRLQILKEAENETNARYQ